LGYAQNVIDAARHAHLLNPVRVFCRSDLATFGPGFSWSVRAPVPRTDPPLSPWKLRASCRRTPRSWAD